MQTFEMILEVGSKCILRKIKNARKAGVSEKDINRIITEARRQLT